ncbi:MAG: hypothetical protein Q4A19_09030 [Johnsonella sp.]|nr:hypothetical protein [Johnsonella sp.]
MSDGDLDWKFGADDVEYNLNLLAKRLKMPPIREYPPYEEGQPLGYEALEMIMSECEHAAIAIAEGCFCRSEETGNIWKI